MRLADQLRADLLVLGIRQHRGDQSFSTVEPSPENVVLPPNLIEKGAEVMQRRAGEFLAAIRLLSFGAFVDQTRRVFRTDAQHFDDVRFTDFTREQDRKTDLIEIIKLAEVPRQILPNAIKVGTRKRKPPTAR